MLQNDFFSSKFSIMKISFASTTTIPETSKTVKGNFGIFEEKCRVQEETPLFLLTNSFVRKIFVLAIKKSC